MCPGLREPYSDHPSPLPYQCLCECSGVIPEFDPESFALNMLLVGGSNDTQHTAGGSHPAVRFDSLSPSPLHHHSPGHLPGRDTG